MTLSNDQVLVSSGTGNTVAFQLASGKKIQVLQRAGPKGHIIGTRRSYIFLQPGGNVATANRLHWDMFNPSGSGVTWEVHGIWLMANADVANAVVALRIDLFRTTTVGTGGNAATFNSTSLTLPTIYNIDPGDADPIAAGEVSARQVPAGGAASGAFIGSAYFAAEESSTGQSYVTEWQNMIRYAQSEDMKDLVVPANSGIKLVQGPVASGGTWGCRVAFSVF